MGRPIPTIRSDKKKVELPFRPPNATTGPVRAIVHVQGMHMVIPSLHAVYVNPSVRIRGGFRSLSRDEFMDVFKSDAEPYFVSSVSNQNRDILMIHLRYNWVGEYEIYLFESGTD